jgi:hypothetical protein
MALQIPKSGNSKLMSGILEEGQFKVRLIDIVNNLLSWGLLEV